MRPDPQRLRRVPRPAEGDRAAAIKALRAARRQRSRSSPATTISSPARSARRSGWPSTASCSATTVEKLTDEELADAAEQDHALRARLARPQAADHRGAAIAKAHRRLHGRRHQRRARPARRRRRHQRRHGRRHRQGVGRHDPAREIPAGARRGRARRAQGLRQHRQVRAHGRHRATSATCSACSGRASSCRSCRCVRFRS